jgi:cyclopropane-fatty-acyl-phospholipid synthase
MPQATNKHYGHKVAFFEGFLDPYMKYSSGLFVNHDEPLDSGILRMLDHLLDSGNLHENARVLDIGNGWGCLLRRLRERFEVDYTGVNPSGVQLEFIRREVEQGARLIEASFEDSLDRLEGPYDTIFMVGALCHIEDKQQALQAASELLTKEGTLVMEDTWFLSEDLYQKHAARPETKFVQNTVFGFAHVTSLAWHMNVLRETGLWQVSSLDNSLDYMYTTDLWCERLAKMNPEMFPLARQAIVYMDVFRRGWGHTICNQVMVLKKLPPRRSAQFDVPAA